MAQPIHPAHDPASTSGTIHKILLIIGAVAFGIVLLMTIMYVYAYEVYYDYLASFDQLFMVFGSVLRLIVIVTFIIWIVQVHRALRQRFPSYPISTVGAIVRFIPVVYIWGIASTFLTIADYLSTQSSLVHKATRIRQLVGPLYLVIFVTHFLNQYIARYPLDASDGLVLVASMFDFAEFVVFLWLTILIQKSIATLYSSPPENIPMSETSEAPAEVINNMPNTTPLT